MNIKICTVCDKEFIPTNPNQKKCSVIHVIPCPICGKDTKIKNKNENKGCSTECTSLIRYGVRRPTMAKEIWQKTVASNADKVIYARDKARATMLKKYGCEDAGNRPEAIEKRKNTNRERYGVDHTFQSEEVKVKAKESLVKKYGVDNPMKSEEIKAKAVHTNVKKYGATNPLSSKSSIRHEIIESVVNKFGVYNASKHPDVIQKIIDTNIKRYGTRSYLSTEEGKEKSRNTSIAKYGVPYASQSEEIKSKQIHTIRKKYGYDNAMQCEEVKQKLSNTYMDKYGVPWYCMTENCISAQGARISKAQQYVFDLVTGLGMNCTMEFPIKNMQFDILINDCNIVMEVNPTYTHNSFGNTWEPKGIPKNYHINKTILANDAGYRCIHIWDWDDIKKVLNIITPKVKLYARNCNINSIDNNDANEFLNKYHIQGTCKGNQVIYGLYYLNELVQIMTFGKPRYNKNYEWELLRLCSKSPYMIIGGSEKLFQSFIRDMQPKSIISYCDVSKFSGNIYEHLGFKFIENTGPSKHWSKGNRHISDNLLRQRGFDQLFGTTFGKGTNNEELMLADGWLPVYDCGQNVYSNLL